MGEYIEIRGKEDAGTFEAAVRRVDSEAGISAPTGCVKQRQRAVNRSAGLVPSDHCTRFPAQVLLPSRGRQVRDDDKSF
ncbi:hypothetical protein [Actinacidiphila sp. bgisy167]|uniref:hypothetical protein n=1 Tax=Actinacidiphila sp. bgisy167 TaxID=3413797 RepID=UPI003D73435B